MRRLVDRSSVIGAPLLASRLMRPEVRDLRYFLTLADELNFTRAAARLNVVQQSLSAGITRLEEQIGVKLFERTTRNVALTDAGTAWLPYARDAVGSVDRAAEVAEDLAAGRAGRLRVGLAATTALNLTPSLLRAVAERHPNVELSVEHFDFQDPSGGLQGGRSDVAIVRPPFEHDGLDLLVVAAEPRYAVLAADHPLAARTTLDFAELADEPWMDIQTDRMSCDFWQVNELRSRPVRVGAVCRTLDDLFESARVGKVVGLVPESVAHAQTWPNLAFVEVRDIRRSTVAIAWRSDDSRTVVRGLVSLAATLFASDDLDPGAHMPARTDHRVTI